MPIAIYPSFIFTVALLFTTAYFLMGGLPLLVLKHDVELDARFIRGFFHVYYVAAFWTSLGATLSFLLWGRFLFSGGALLITLLTTFLRRRMLLAMQHIGQRIQSADAAAIREFRRVHQAALAINFAQLVFLVWGTFQLSRALQ